MEDFKISLKKHYKIFLKDIKNILKKNNKVKNILKTINKLKIDLMNSVI
jgi:hypothetical protein